MEIKIKSKIDTRKPMEKETNYDNKIKITFTLVIADKEMDLERAIQ